MTTVAEPNRKPRRIMSPEQTAKMYAMERLVLEERTKGKSFYKIEKENPGVYNARKIFLRAIGRDGNEQYRRAEAIRLEELRLDELQEGIWPRALQGEPRAVEVALKVLERRARMFGLDFADMISGQLVEVERARVRLVAVALVKALNVVNATDDQKRQATEVFMGELRAITAEKEEKRMSPEDEDLL